MFSKVQKNQKKLSQEERQRLSQQSQVASSKYNAVWCTPDGGYKTNAIYLKATIGKSVRYANALIDDALSLCGDPWYTLSQRRLCKEARDFLALFESTKDKGEL